MTEERKKRIPIDGNHADEAKNSDSGREPGQARESMPDDRELETVHTGPHVETGPGPGSAQPAGAPRPDAEMETELDAERLKAERDNYLDNLLRLKAEFENFRKRSRRELAESESRAKGSLLTEFLPILDNLERALGAAEEHEEAKLVDGVRMTYEHFARLLEHEGVERMDPAGQPFDPEHQEAVFAQASEEEEGTVIQVLERGYLLGERVLRPAKVVVSAGEGG